MKRRDLVGLGAVGLLSGGAIGIALGFDPLASDDAPGPDYLGEEPIVYERDDLRLLALQDTVHRGETITFEITNTGSSGIDLGCNITWALQTHVDGQWRHVTWTGRRYYQVCFTGLSAGKTASENVPLSESALASEEDISEVITDLTPGEYRFVLIGSPPYLAVDFRLLPPE